MSDSPNHPETTPDAGVVNSHADWIAAARSEFEDFRHGTTVRTDSSVRKHREQRLAAVAVPGYEIREELARGGQGVVFRALQTSTGREVALKIVREGPFASNSDKARFEREVRILARLRHPSIVAIHDSGEAAGFQYFVMAYVAGPSLDAFLADHRSNLKTVLSTFAQVCEAVDAAHVRGVIHRDLKPANIRVDAQGVPHVLDFGLAKQPEPEQDDRDLTATGAFIGSLPWASPEQVMGPSGGVDMRSDVYSLGVTLYHALAGQPPYEVAGSARAVMDRIATAQPKSLRNLRRDIDDELETIVLKCLAKEPERRYQTAGELARDLRSYLAGDAISAKRDSAWYLLRKQVGRHRVMLAGSLAFLVLLVASTIVAWWLYSDAESARLQERARLWESYVAQARAERATERVGRKAASLAAIRAALDLRPDATLRDDVVASLSLFDLVQHRTVHGLYATTAGLNNLDRYAYLSEANNIQVRPLAPSGPTATLRGSSATMRTLQFSPDGRYVASKFDGDGKVDLYVWELPDGQVRLHLEGQEGLFLGHCDFDPQGRWLACIQDQGQVAVYSLPDGALQTTFSGPAAVWKLAVSPSGQDIALCGNSLTEVLIWNTTQQAIARNLPCGSELLGLDWSPDGRWLAAGATDHQIYLWDVATDRPPRRLSGHQAQVAVLQFDSNSRILASSGWDSQTRVWDVNSGNPLTAPLVGHYLNHVTDELALREPDGLSFWRFDPPEIVRAIHLEDMQGQIRLAAGARGDWFVASGAGGVRLFYSAAPNREPLSLTTAPTALPVITADDQQIYAVTNARIQRWRLEAGSASMVAGHTETIPLHLPVREVGITADPDLIVTVGGGMVRWVATRSGEITQELNLARGAIEPAISRNNRWLFVGNWKGDAGGSLIDLITNRVARTFPGEHITGAFSPSVDELAWSSKERLVLLDLSSLTERFSIIRQEGSGLASPMAFSPDGVLLAATTSPSQIELLDPKNGNRLVRLPNPELYMISDICFADHGRKLLVSTTNNIIQVWDIVAMRRALHAMGLDW